MGAHHPTQFSPLRRNLSDLNRPPTRLRARWREYASFSAISCYLNAIFHASLLLSLSSVLSVLSHVVHLSMLERVLMLQAAQIILKTLETNSLYECGSFDKIFLYFWPRVLGKPIAARASVHNQGEAFPNRYLLAFCLFKEPVNIQEKHKPALNVSS